MDRLAILKGKNWYLPTLLERWHSRANDDGDELAQLVAMNHLDAVVECESVDISFLVSCMSDDEPQPSSADLIDKFLSLSDFRIEAPVDEEVDVEQDWELVDVEYDSDPKDEFVSEELARIYLKQGLYAEAKEIYSKLSLQYSEKSIYFADLTERLAEKISGKSGK
ncbi:MAG: hypothetical protein SNH63_01485 [Rikenellaceae bacterium]